LKSTQAAIVQMIYWLGIGAFTGRVLEFREVGCGLHNVTDRSVYSLQDWQIAGMSCTVYTEQNRNTYRRFIASSTCDKSLARTRSLHRSLIAYIGLYVVKCFLANASLLQADYIKPKCWQSA